jgi:hypothetical protein
VLRFVTGAIIVTALFSFINGVYIFQQSSVAQGAFDFASFTSHATVFLALIVGTFSGVVSSILVLSIGETGMTFRDAVDRRAIVLACTLSPVVMSGFYDKVATIDSGWIIFLLAHQNGFFWENVSTRIRVGSSK